MNYEPKCSNVLLLGDALFLPPRIGGVFLYEEVMPIRGIGTIEKRHHMGKLSP